MKITISPDITDYVTMEMTESGKWYRDQEGRLYFSTIYSCVCITSPGLSYERKAGSKLKLREVPTCTIITIQV